MYVIDPLIRMITEMWSRNETFTIGQVRLKEARDDVNFSLKVWADWSK